ncbi:MAG: NAD(P)H-hydrate dehydratase [Bacteroidota bacterium]
MKILSAEQIREADKYTIEHEPISSVDLMERASLTFAEKFKKCYSVEKPVVVIAGKGNNGGDGLAIARILSESGYKVSIYTFGSDSEGSDDFKENFRRLDNSIPVVRIQEDLSFSDLEPNTILLDAIFGTGLSLSVEGAYSKVIESMNNSSLEIVSVDIPSGLFCDELNKASDIIVRASRTFTFQLPKLTFFLPETENHLGVWEVLDIDLDNDFIQNSKTRYHLNDQKGLKPLYKKRSKYSHKGNFGKCLLIGGSYGKMGAMVLMSRACLKSGAGLITSHIPKCGYEILQSTVPEVMCSTSSSPNMLDDIPKNLNNYDVIGIGPGLGKSDETISVVKQLLRNYSEPIIFDADALNIIAHGNMLNFISPGSILTPHVKEFDRLFGKNVHSFERIKKAHEYSQERKVICVLKGAHTAIITPEKVYFNDSGNPGMATGGSGDVLTGIITGLLGQGYSPSDSARIGVFLHGASGDIAKQNEGEEFISASSIIDNLGKAILQTFSED